MVQPQPEHRFAVFALLTVAVAGCSTRLDSGQCGVNADCPGDEVCLFDIARDTSYCARQGCSLGQMATDCPDFQECREARLNSDAMSATFCVDRVRACNTDAMAPESCNGLDDDCNGLVDDNCVIQGCSEDARCGAFVCRALENQAEAFCAPANPDATVANFEPCDRDEQCTNGLCESGLCSPLCSPGDDDACPTVIGADGLEARTVCTSGIGPGNRPGHNLCHKICTLTSGPCAANEICALRAEFGRREPSRVFACTLADPGLLPLGASCPANDLAGDSACQYGLCFMNVCTRVCRQTADSCADVGPDFRCADVTLVYNNGVDEIGTSVCVRRP